MTFDTECRNWIRREAAFAMYPKPHKPGEDKGSEDVIHADEVGALFRWPPLQQLSEYYVDFSTVIRGSRVKPRYQGDSNYLSTGGSFLSHLSGWLRNVLWNTSVQVLVICMDEMGRTPACKKALTATARQKGIQDLEELWPEQNPLRDDVGLPYDINSIWYNWRARCHLFEYITHYLVNRFLDIPEGKQLVIEGGRLPSSRCSCPLVISSSLVEAHNASGVVVLDRGIQHSQRGAGGEAPFGSGYPPAEGELKLFSHLYRSILSRPLGSSRRPQIVMQSIDGDTILIALLQAPRWAHLLDLYILGKRSLGSEPQPEKVRIGLQADFQRRLQQAKAAGLGPAALQKMRSPLRNRTVYCSEYVDVNRLRGILERRVGSPETFVLLTSLRGNDYVQKLAGVGFRFILAAYLKYRQEEDGEPVLQIGGGRIPPQERIGYELDVAALFALCYRAYGIKNKGPLWRVDPDFSQPALIELQRERGWSSPEPAQARLLQAEALYTTMYLQVRARMEADRAVGKRKTLAGLPSSPDVIWTTAYNLRWLFRYFGNGADPCLHQPSGLEREDDSGLSAFGYQAVEGPDGLRDVRLSSEVDKRVLLLRTEEGPQVLKTSFDDCPHCTQGRAACEVKPSLQRTTYCREVSLRMQQAGRG